MGKVFSARILSAIVCGGGLIVGVAAAGCSGQQGTSTAGALSAWTASESSSSPFPFLSEAKLDGAFAVRERYRCDLRLKVDGDLRGRATVRLLQQAYDKRRHEWAGKTQVVEVTTVRGHDASKRLHFRAPKRGIWRYRAEVLAASANSSTTLSNWAEVRVCGDKPVALTFDDGPDYDGTPAVLRELKQHSAHATFFVLGWRAERYPELVGDIYRGGHQIGSHRYTHLPGIRLSKSDFTEEVERSKRAIEDDIKEAQRDGGPARKQPVIFRYPWGASSPKLDAVVKRNHMRIYGWDYASGDGGEHGPYDEYISHLIASKVINHVKPGDVVLMHDAARRPNSVAAVPVILSALERQGYDFVTCEELRQLR